MDCLMKPIVKSYVKDSTDFINKIESNATLPVGTIIRTLDVSSLYTNIPHEEGIESIKNQLVLNRESFEKPRNNSLLNLLELVLKRNNFKFNGTNFLQIGGTAMEPGWPHQTQIYSWPL